MGFKMYAYAHASDVKVITVTSIADFRNEISERTPSGNGVITDLATSFKNMKTPAPFDFTWKLEKGIPATLFSALKRSEEFTLELRIQEVDDKGKAGAHFNFNFYRCKVIKTRNRSGKIKVEASYGLFEKRPD